MSENDIDSCSIVIQRNQLPGGEILESLERRNHGQVTIISNS